MDKMSGRTFGAVTAPPITTLLVDDEPDIRLVMRLAIEMDDDGLTVAGEAEDGDDAVRQARELAPSVVVLDLRMPHLDGLSAAARILADNPDQAIVLCTAHLDAQLMRDARALGIRACVSKVELADIATVVRRVSLAA
jgi:DNA-binding NarL/FixJ family response regulator